MEKILLVDDEIEILKDKSRIIEDMGFECITAGDGTEAVDLIEKAKPDIVLTDQKMPGQDGFQVLKIVQQTDPDIPVIIFTGHGTVESAVEAMRMGAYDYIQKPLLPEMMEAVLKRAVEYRKLKRENIILRTQIEETYELPNIVASSSVMRAVAKRVTKIAKSEMSVLIYGESGTGKELIARSIHYYSLRKDKPFIPFDCVALPATLLESELFGFEKGAFTGAVSSKPGVFELAETGTLFLDEITEMDLHLQAKLLRVIQERQFRRIGGTEFKQVNVRIISATNRNPEEALKEKWLRADLYYRLNVVPIHVPPLRERVEDIPLLVHHFIKKYDPFSPNEIKGITREAMNRLKNHTWPGNVRELENIIQRTMSLTDHEMIQLNDLPEQIINSRDEDGWLSSLDLPFKEARSRYLREFGKHYLNQLIEKHSHNMTRVAKSAGISRATLYRMLKEFEMIP